MLDINPEMLEEGKKRFARTMYHDGELLLSFELEHTSNQMLLSVLPRPTNLFHPGQR